MESLAKCEANYVALTPLSFLERAAVVYAERTSVIYGDVRFTWAQTMDRCRRIASALVNLYGVQRGEVVSVLAPNVPALYESHFAVPMAGAVLNTINSRLNAANVATILSHSQAKVLFVDHEFVPLANEALVAMAAMATAADLPHVVVIHDDPYARGMVVYDRILKSNSRAVVTYEDLVRGGDPEFRFLGPLDEWDSITLNYTSGTTSAPKGVVYSHRGAYLSSLSMLLLWQMGTEAVYLWTLPMFHCNGWTFTWAVAARGGTNVCIRSTAAREIYSSIAQHRVTHLCCAPIVFNILLNARPEERRPVVNRVDVLTGGAPPPEAVVAKMESIGFCVTHAYGLTEATGPALACEWKTEWDGLPMKERGALKRRQGVGVLSLADFDVKDPDTMQSVARDGATMGEIMIRGSSLMKGYLRDEKATAEAFTGGWFRTGDVGVLFPDGYVEIKDRSKDVIISGGENISSVEVESVLYSHPDVTEAAVVAMPHAHWGETPCAFVLTKRGVSEEDIIRFCRDKLPHYMVPKAVVFMELPKTSTGKIQKFVLRELAKKLHASGAATSKGIRKKPAAKPKQPNRFVSVYNDQQEQHYVVARSRL